MNNQAISTRIDKAIGQIFKAQAATVAEFTKRLLQWHEERQLLQEYSGWWRTRFQASQVTKTCLLQWWLC